MPFPGAKCPMSFVGARSREMCRLYLFTFMSSQQYMVVHYSRILWENSYAEHEVTGKRYNEKLPSGLNRECELTRQRIRCLSSRYKRSLWPEKQKKAIQLIASPNPPSHIH